MGKYVKKTHHFLWGTLIYGVIFLMVGAGALWYLWSFLDAYEQTRPQTTLAEYQQRLTGEYIGDGALWLRDSLDTSVQTEEEFRQVISDAVSGGVTTVRKSRECTENRMVYVLRSGTQVIGEIVMEAGGEDSYGFSPWTVTGETFDFSHLQGESVSLTVPREFTVSVNGHLLDSSHVTQDAVPFEALADYYESYELPSLVTYEAGPILGETEVEVRDPQGNAVSMEENMDWTFVYDNCPQEKRPELDAFIQEFVRNYVSFTGSNATTSTYNYHVVVRNVVPESDFARRLLVALDGLQYGSSIHDEIVSLTTHSQTVLDEHTWLCDITYEVDTTGKKGVVRTTTNARIEVVETDLGLRVLTMNVY